MYSNEIKLRSSWSLGLSQILLEHIDLYNNTKYRDDKSAMMEVSMMISLFVVKMKEMLDAQLIKEKYDM